MKVGLFESVRGIPFDELLDLAKDSGIEALELGVAGRSSTPGSEADRMLQDPERRAQVQESIARHGMVISALNRYKYARHIPSPVYRPMITAPIRVRVAYRCSLGILPFARLMHVLPALDEKATRASLVRRRCLFAHSSDLKWLEGRDSDHERRAAEGDKEVAHR